MSKENFRYRFPDPGQPIAVVVWPSDKRWCRAVKLEESGYEEVHIRWPSTELEDIECDEPNKVAREIADRLAGYVQHRRKADEIAAFEEVIFQWIMEQRATVSLKAQDDHR